jgi:Flp pilus assembly protein TadG
MPPAPRRPRRAGAAIVELAICLPVLVMVSLAAVEACGLIYLKQSLKIAAYEGARVGVVPGAKAADVQSQCNLILDARKVRQYAVEFTPSQSTQPADTGALRVTVSAPAAANSLLGRWFLSEQDFTESVEVLAR